MSLVSIILNSSDLTSAQLESIVNFAENKEGGIQLADHITSLVGGVRSGSLVCRVGAVAATATITSTGTAGNTETMTLANQTITAVTSGATPADGEFNISATVADQAASIALAINSLPALAGIVTATSALGVVTVTSVLPGYVGNGLQIVDVDLANTTVGVFANGAEGTTYTLDYL